MYLQTFNNLDRRWQQWMLSWRTLWIYGKWSTDSDRREKISIGSDCLIAYNVVLRTGDSHAIFDENSRRINNAKDISIGDKVWIADGVIVLKGAKIADSTIIGSNAVVTGKSFPSHTVIAGNPAKIVKENVTWTPERDA